jgi:hypothetical protein
MKIVGLQHERSKNDDIKAQEMSSAMTLVTQRISRENITRSADAKPVSGVRLDPHITRRIRIHLLSTHAKLPSPTRRQPPMLLVRSPRV